MKKILLLLAFLIPMIAHAQVWNNVSNALQMAVSGSDTTFRTNLGGLVGVWTQSNYFLRTRPHTLQSIVENITLPSTSPGTYPLLKISSNTSATGNGQSVVGLDITMTGNNGGHSGSNVKGLTVHGNSEFYGANTVVDSIFKVTYIQPRSDSGHTLPILFQNKSGSTIGSIDTTSRFIWNGNVRFSGLSSGTPLYNVLIDGSGNLITGTAPIVPSGTYLTLASPNQTVNQVPTFSNGLVSGGGGNATIANLIIGNGTLIWNNQAVASNPGNTNTWNQVVLFGKGTNSQFGVMPTDDYVNHYVLDSLIQFHKLDVFMIAGQSNAKGFLSDQSLQPAIPAGQAFIFQSGAISQTTTGPIGSGTSGSAWPAFAIAYYKKTGHAVLFVPCAVNGTSQTAAADVGNGNWDTTGLLTAAAIARTDSALAKIAANEKTAIFKGVLWDQGEQDITALDASTITIGTYTTAFTTMRATFRTHYGSSMDFFIFRVGETTANALLVQASQEAAAVSENNTHVVFRSSRDFTISNGNLNAASALHYTQAGYNIMGQIGGEVCATYHHFYDWQYEFGNFGTFASTIGTQVSVNANLTTSGIQTSATGVNVNPIIQSDITATAVMFNSAPQTVNSLGITNIIGFRAQLGTLGTGNTITANTGFYAPSTFVTASATNNYAFKADNTTGYTFYADGGGTFHQKGLVGLGTIVSPIALLNLGSTRTLAAWGNSAPNILLNANTLTDNSTADGATVTNAVMSSIGVTTLQATNAATNITYTNASTLQIAGPVTAGTNVTITNNAALDVLTGNVRVRGLTVSRAVFTDANDNLVSNAISGTGSVAMTTSPTFVTPTLGAASATSINKVIITAPATSATLTIANGKTLTDNNTVTLSGTDGNTYNLDNNISVLATITGINAKTTGTTALYTVPTGKTLTVTGIYVRCTTATGATVAASADVGDSGNGAASIYANNANTFVVNKIYQYTPAGIYFSVASGNVVNYNINTGGTATTLTYTVTLVGFLQ